ncbi:MAG: Threonine-phosphate decarboxylase [Chroococcopsis gigantea SAG 12.99]|nr:Threonine-phosphate decarboxylase [Chroococcopsis gigantea SAG 12.99]
MNWASAIAGCSVSLITDFSASINPLGPPASAIAAMQSAFSQVRNYPDPNYETLRAALGQWHNVSPDWILPGNGSAELLTWACRELSSLDHTCLLTPAFSDYGRALKAFSAKIKPYPLIPAEGMSLKLNFPSDSISKGLILNNPHNPTGKLFTLEEITPHLDKFALVVVDEAFMDFLPPAQQQSLIALLPIYDNLIILRSLTKFYSLAGLRIGYALSHPARLSRWQKWRDPWSVNILSEVASIACIRDEAFQTSTYKWLIPAREKLFSSLASIPGLQPFPGAANFLLVRCRQSCLPLQEYLLRQHKIYIRDCVSFPELGENYFRIAVRAESDNERLVSSLVSYFA